MEDASEGICLAAERPVLPSRRPERSSRAQIMIRKILPYARRLYSLLPEGRLKRALHLLWITYRKVHKGSIVLATVDGIRFRLDLSEVIDSSLYYLGAFEPNTTRTLTCLCKPGMVVVDVGANIGCHTLPMARLVGPGGRVVAFEPMSWAFEKLRGNIDLNPELANIIAERTALSDEVRPPQQVRFNASWTVDGGSQTDGAAPELVRVTTLDSYVETANLGNVGLVKIDVDGYEFKILRGSVRLLREQAPALLLEVGTYTLAKHGDSAMEMVRYLAAFGYRFFSDNGFEPLGDMEGLVRSIPFATTVNVVASRTDPRCSK